MNFKPISSLFTTGIVSKKLYFYFFVVEFFVEEENQKSYFGPSFFSTSPQIIQDKKAFFEPIKDMDPLAFPMPSERAS